MIRARRLPRNQRNANAGAGEERARRLWMVAAERERADAERHVDVAEQRRVGRHETAARHRRATLQHRSVKPTLVSVRGPGLRRRRALARRRRASSGRSCRGRGSAGATLACPAHPLAGPAASRFFAGAADDFADVELDLDDGLLRRLRSASCARCRAARSSPTASSPRSPAAPGAARAAGTFCARNRLSPFVPCHRVVAADGIGSFGSLGVDYKRRLLALEGVAL